MEPRKEKKNLIVIKLAFKIVIIAIFNQVKMVGIHARTHNEECGFFNRKK